MDSNRSKRRSFSKSKLIKSFSGATKPSSAALQPYNSKLPKPSATNTLPTSFEFPATQPIKPKTPPFSTTAGFIRVDKDQFFPQSTPKVTVVMTDRNRDFYGKVENFYGGGAAMEDEGVDAKADKYISSVQERFRLAV